MQRAAATRLLFNDMLGSTVAVLDGDKASPTGMTLFGETPDGQGAGFFTGKPHVDEFGYAFLFRNYRPEKAKWQTADPLGYPDGWNCLAYVNNGVNVAVDYLGLYIEAIYSISKHQFSCKLTRNNSIIRKLTNQVFSGAGEYMNDPKAQHIVNMGPIPDTNTWAYGKVTVVE